MGLCPAKAPSCGSSSLGKAGGLEGGAACQTFPVDTPGVPTSTLKTGVTQSLRIFSNGGAFYFTSAHTQKERKNMRILTEKQWAELVKTLQGQGGCGVQITHMPKNLTSYKLAWDFYDLLLQPSWQVEKPCPMKLLSSDEVQVGVADCANPPRSAQLLHDALTAVGVRTPGHLVRGNGASLDRCCLIVGTTG